MNNATRREITLQKGSRATVTALPVRMPESAAGRLGRRLGKTGSVAVLLLMLLALPAVFRPALAQIVFESASSATGINGNGVEYVGSGSFATADTTTCASASVIPSIPAGSVGDLLIALVNGREDNATLATTAGWSPLVVPTSYPGSQDFKVAIYYRIATGSDSLTISQSGTCNSIGARVARFSGVDTVAPFDGTPGSSTQSADYVSSGTVTTTSGDAMLLAATFVADRRIVYEDSAWTQAFDSAANLGRDLEISLNYQASAAVGSQSFSNWNIDKSGNRLNFGIIFAIKPSTAVRRIDIPMPSGVVANDVLVAALSVRHNAATVTPPSGWTLIRDTPQSSGAATCNDGTTAGIRTLSYYKVATASEATASFGYSSTCYDDGFAAAGILRFSGVDTANPVVASAAATTGSGTLHQAPAVTPGVANTMLITVHSYGSSRSWNEGYSGVSSMTERIDQRSYGADNVLGTTLGVYTQSLTATGSTGTRTAQGAGDADNGATHSIALQPIGINHIRIEHDGAAAGCTPETVTVKACGNANCTSLYSGSVTTTLSPSGWSINPITFTGGSTTASLTATSSGPITLGAASTSPAPSVATRCFNGATETCAMTVSACPTASCSSGTVTAGIVNTYYAGTADAASGQKVISVGSSSGASTALATNDLVLIIQTQNATLTTTDGSTYGTLSASSVGQFEYGKVASVGAGSITLVDNLTYSYSATSSTSDAIARKTFQVIRIPTYSSATLPASGLTAKTWDGSSGGVLALDVTGTLALNGAVVDVSGKGFRGGGGFSSTSGSGSSTTYRTPAKTNGANGAKGEGIAGTPYRTFDGSTTATNTWEGYPNGSNARGAPANGGGGGTDGNPADNSENTGGGGGANAGAGGKGGIGWCAAFDDTIASPYACDDSGGIGGYAVSSLGANKLVLGGGGGAATSNNGTGTPNAGRASSGARGGGAVLIRAGTLTGTATINANGADANDTVCNDGSGGGGGAGAVLISAASGLNGVTINVTGGEGGTNLNPSSCTSGPHGPGGGGGGGYALTTSAPAACNRSGGAAGNTYDNGTLFGAYGAVAGTAGSCNTLGTLAADIKGKALGEGPCTSSLGSFGVSAPGTASTCGRYPALANPSPPPASFPLPPIVTVTARDAGGSTMTGYTGTINLTTSTGRGLWAKTALANGTLNPNPDTSNDGAASYTFVAADNGVAQLYLTDDVSDTLTVTAQDSTDSSKSGTSGSISYSTNAFAVTEDSIQVAGKPQSMSVALWSQDSGKNCAVATGYTGSQTVKAWLARSGADPGGTAPTIGAVSLPNAMPTSDNLTLSFTNGVASFNLNTTDVGAYSLNLQDTTTFSGSSVTVSGSSNALLVRPFAVVVDCVKQGGAASTAASCPADGTANPGANTAAGTIYAKAGTAFQARVSAYLWSSAADANNDGLPDSGASVANVSGGGIATKFAHSVTLSAGTPYAPTTPSDAPAGTGTAGTLGDGTVAVSAGSTTVATLTYSEVGAFTLGATPAVNYLGSLSLTNRTLLFTPGTTACTTACVVGRFIPDHFALTPAEPSHACGTGINAFTYFGQDFATPFTLTAQRYCTTCSAADTTKNYDDTLGWSRFTTTTWSNYAFTADNSVTLTAGTAAPTGTWADGVASITAAHKPTRPAAPVAPVDVTVSATPTDADGVTLASATAVNSTAAPLRYGMLKIGNASGSERQNLPVPVTAMYYAGSAIGWAVNTLDGCTATLALTAFGTNTTTAACYGSCTAVDTGSTGSVLLRRPAGNTGNQLAIAAAPTPAGAVTTLASGRGFVTLRAPNTGAPAVPTPGALDLILVAPAWLRANSGQGGTVGNYDWNPLGRITFGVTATGNKTKFIYIRENY